MTTTFFITALNIERKIESSRNTISWSSTLGLIRLAFSVYCCEYVSGKTNLLDNCNFFLIKKNLSAFLEHNKNVSKLFYLDAKLVKNF